jgi:circadian clock protein KaiC
MTRLMEKASSGIDGLDYVLGGGFLWGSTLLVAGNPGSGKSLFGAQFIYEGIKHGEPGVYASFTFSKEEFFNYMKDFGMDFRRKFIEGEFSFLELPLTTDRKILDQLIYKIFESINKIDAKRLVIDTVNPLFSILTRNRLRSFLYNAIIKPVKSLNIVAVLLYDLLFNSVNTIQGISEFLVDGVIFLKTYYQHGIAERILQIIKMKGMSLHIRVFRYYIDNKGIHLLLPNKNTY